MSSHTRMILTIHDVEPGNLPDIIEFVVRCEKLGICAMIAAIPGRRWSRRDTMLLRSMKSNGGHEIAQHGYTHEASGPLRGIYTSLHSFLFSNGVAEHLTYSRSEMLNRIERGKEWLSSITDVNCYIPPAWASGNVRLCDYQRIGFGFVELMYGYADLHNRQFVVTPVIGFQATSRTRLHFLRLWNAGCLTINHKIMRVAVHPEDIGGCMYNDLLNVVRRCRFTLLNEMGTSSSD